MLLIKELQEILQKNTSNGCEKDEALALKVMVDADAKIKLVYEQDTAATSNNKCAYDLAKNALKYTGGWQPATVNNEKVYSEKIIKTGLSLDKEFMGLYEQKHCLFKLKGA